MRRLVVGSILALLAGCAQSGGIGKAENQAALNAMAAERDGCLKDLPERVGSYSRRARCINTALYNYTARVRGDYSYAQRIAVARSDLAAKIDSSEISPQEGVERLKLKLAEINASEAQYLKEKEADDQAASTDRKITAYQAVFGGSQPAPVYQAPMPQMNLQPLQMPSNQAVNCSSYASGALINTNCR